MMKSDKNGRIRYKKNVYICAKYLITIGIYKVFLSFFVLARGTLKSFFCLKLNSQLLRGGKSSYNLWSELLVIESKSLAVIDCLRWESVSKLA